MRGFLLMAIFAGGLWTIDTLMFDGRNTMALWQEAKSTGQEFRYELKSRLRFLKF